MRNKAQFLIMKRTVWVMVFVALVICQTSKTQTITENFGSGADSFSVEFVKIGNLGNSSDPLTSKGSVAYEYNISKFEISQSQIQKAINSGVNGIEFPGGAWSNNQPGSVLNWFQAATFVNYLNVSQGFNAAYNLTHLGSANFTMNLWSSSQAWTLGGQNLFRHKDAKFFLPSENEWYKAAYYDASLNNNNGGYWLYPTMSNLAPPPISGGSSGAVFGGSAPADVNNAGGESWYGTVGQGGNVVERTETAADGVNDSPNEDRISLGGSYFESSDLLKSTTQHSHTVLAQFASLGFRVASVPEPSALSLLAVGLGGLAMIRRRRS